MEILFYISNFSFVFFGVLRFYKYYISKEVKSLAIGIVILLGSTISLIFHAWIPFGLSLILLWIMKFTNYGRNKKRILLISLIILFVAIYVWFFKSRYNERIEFVKPIIESLNFDSIPEIDSTCNRIMFSPYLECFVSDDDRYLFNIMDHGHSNGMLLSTNLGFFTPLDSLKTIFFIRCNRFQSANYSRYNFSDKGPDILKTNYETFEVLVFVYNCETKVIVAYKNFIPPPLKESYSSGESPKQLNYSFIHDYVINLLN